MSITYLLIRHLTRFVYSDAIKENSMELRMRPLEDNRQQCHDFKLNIRPKAETLNYVDGWGNTVHHFNIPQPHKRLEITSETKLGLRMPPPLPDSLPHDTWQAIDEVANVDHWHFVHDSQFVTQTEQLRAFSTELSLARNADPLTTLRQLNTDLYNAFDYDQSQTTVDSTIDVALAARGGVCQDFAHIMIALVRGLGIPCRYVSGYLMRQLDVSSDERSAEDESHAWVEAWLPELGWIGFDPTNNLVDEGRHVRVAVGRDYADVPPTRGVFLGSAQTELSVGVYIGEIDAPAPESTELLPALAWQAAEQPSGSQWQAQQQQ